MERVRGTVLNGDDVVLKGLDITLTLFEPARGLPSWSGSFYVQDPRFCIKPGVPYWLVLEDGRSGKLFLSRLNLGSPRGTGIDFKGSGPLS